MQVHLTSLNTVQMNYYFFFSFFLLRELGENMNDDELRAMIDEFDKDKDGESE